MDWGSEAMMNSPGSVLSARICSSWHSVRATGVPPWLGQQIEEAIWPWALQPQSPGEERDGATILIHSSSNDVLGDFN